MENFAVQFKKVGFSAEADFSQLEAPLKRVGLVLLENVENAEISVVPLPDRPPDLPPVEGFDVYGYVEISVSIPEELIARAELEFSLPRSLIEARGVIENSVRLFRFHSGGWQELPTSKIRENGKEILFRAITPGFSTFAYAYVSSEFLYEGQTSGVSGRGEL